MTLVLQIEGAAIDDIACLYAEINRVFMAGEAWQLGPSPFRAVPACLRWRQPCAPAVNMDGPVPAPLRPPSGAAGCPDPRVPCPKTSPPNTPR